MVIGNSREEGRGLSKAKTVKQMYEPYLEFPVGWGRGAQENHPFLELHKWTNEHKQHDKESKHDCTCASCKLRAIAFSKSSSLSFVRSITSAESQSLKHCKFTNPMNFSVIDQILLDNEPLLSGLPGAFCGPINV